MDRRLASSYFILLASCGITLYAFTLPDVNPLIYVIFPLIIIMQISFLLRTYLQESIPPVDKMLLRSSGWIPDPDMEHLELGGPQEYWCRGEETVFGHRKPGGTLKILNYYDGAGEVYENEEVNTEMIGVILDTHTPTHTPAQAPEQAQAEALTGSSPDSDAPPSPPEDDSRAISKSIKEQKEKKEKKPESKNRLVRWLENLRAENVEKLEARRTRSRERWLGELGAKNRERLEEDRALEEIRQKREIKDRWRNS